jgi:hypothetical protein
MPAALWRVLAALALTVTLAACGSHATSCPEQIPTCPSPPPSFVAEVNPIVQSVCVPCHGPGGIEATRPYLTYEDMKAFGPFTTMYSQVLGCTMPKAPQQFMGNDDRQRLLEWFACGEPDDRGAADASASD